MSERGDLFDQATEHELAETAYRIEQQRAKAAAIPAGTPGDCDYCGNPSPRLVDGHCAPCRDKYRLP
jgi:hypothetical protein